MYTFELMTTPVCLWRVLQLFLHTTKKHEGIFQSSAGKMYEEKENSNHHLIK